ncbi:hypothetical protein F2Q68_00017263 [Brassica cretica]|uniref:Zinc knuckle CX2CX4HX4C domain-containing protein n=1 Tax=Brassica cretica TaxID=69181 RepID=A0A8S9HIA1_BRACR|nr:hypothetical protein F2Q68_00017263 [Brassica cretica]
MTALRHHFEIIISTHRSILWWPINHPQIDLCHLTERPLPKPHKPVLSSSPSFHLHQRFSRTILVLDRSSTSPSGSEIVIFIEITIYFEIAVLRLCPLIVSLHCDFFPIVHDDYPWIIPFWVGITGIPLHLWTSKNLKKIGSKLGHVGEDKIKESEGRMCIDVDTRKPLIFSKKILSPGGDEVTIQIKYELRFKHCTFCGMLSHELSHCTKKEQGSSNQMERAYVFSRVQLPIGASARQPLLREQKPHDRYDRYEHRESKYHHNVDVHSSKRILEVNGYRRTAYARHDDSSDWPKERVETQREIVESIREPYALMALQLQIGASSSMPREIPAEIEPHNISGQRTASLIITPSRHLTEQDDNVTKRIKTIPRSIMFSRTEELHPHNAQMIDALSEMEIVIENKNDDGKEELMECDGDDLLGQDLMELEEGASNLIPVADTDATGVLKKERARGSSSTRGVGRSGILLSLPIKKAEFLRRGSPKHR